MSAIAWFEIHADDLAACAAFYADVFGWRAEKMSDEHWHLHGDEGAIGLVFRRRGAAAPLGSPVNAFVCTFACDDIDRACARALEQGAVAGRNKFPVPGGTAAYLNDPFGNIFGVFQAGGSAS